MKKIRAFLAAMMMLTAMSASMAAETTAAAAEQLLDGTYVIRNVNSGIYLNVSGGSTENGTNVQQWGTDAAHGYDTWMLESDGDGYYRIYSMVGGGRKCLLNAGDGTSDANVCIYENTGKDEQLFRLSANADGSFKIVSKASEKAVEVINAETAAGANVQQWEINGASCQDWELIPVDYRTGGMTETKCEVSGDVFTPGDVNDDGIINVFDLLMEKRLLLKGGVTEHQKHAANVSGDDAFTLADMVKLQKYLLTGKGDFIREDVPLVRTYAGVDAAFTEGVAETTNAGYRMDAYLNLDNKAGVEAVWNIFADESGAHAVTVRFANGGAAAREVKVCLNNQIYYWTLEGKTTGAWTEWTEETLILPLNQGVNQLTFISETADGAPNIDFVSVESSDKALTPGTPIAPIKGVPENTGGGIYGVGIEMENLNRGVMAANAGNGVLVSWRKLATDAENTSFKLYKNGELVTEIPAGGATNYFVEGGTAADTYTVDTFVGSTMTEFANAAVMLGTKNSGQSGAYMDIPLNKPDAQTMPDGSTCTYSPNDCSVGDVDGDGAYEIILKWDPSNSQDNSKSGYTGTVFLDCYKLDGTQLWRIDLGKNIRAGAHYTQFMVYDLDGDGKAELMCKTADGTKDAAGKYIGDANADYRSASGTILTGPEYLTLFDGETGKALDTINYEPERGDIQGWGDNYGNRSERYLAGVAYLDGQHPSVLFCRGYYERAAIAAYDVKDNKIVKRWIYDTGSKNSSDGAYGQGNHSVAVMDVDGDGKDELLYGSCCIDDNGKLLWSTKLGHGDCMQAGDLLPERPGLEVFQVHEETTCAEIHDAATGEVIWRVDSAGDVGRGIALNMSAGTPGMEFTSVADGKVYYYNPSSGKVEEAGYGWNDKIKWSMNSAVWWDGDLEREALDRTMVESPDKGRLFTGDGAGYNNGSKSNACLTCDLMGDWREEMIFPANDGNSLRVFGTTFATDIPLFTLMHDAQYRTGVAIENVAYNQAPNTSFFLGTGYDLPETPVVYTPASPRQ